VTYDLIFVQYLALTALATINLFWQQIFKKKSFPVIAIATNDLQKNANL
jgi:hypothetical protein